MSDSLFALAVVSLPTLGGLAAVAVVYTPKWRRKRRLRILDEMFEQDREWWEEQFRDLGHKRPPE